MAAFRQTEQVWIITQKENKLETRKVYTSDNELSSLLAGGSQANNEATQSWIPPMKIEEDARPRENGKFFITYVYAFPFVNCLHPWLLANISMQIMNITTLNSTAISLY